VRVGISGLAIGNAGGLGRLSRTYLLALAGARPEWDLHVYLRDSDHLHQLADECDRDTRPLLDHLQFHFAPARWLNRVLLEELDLPRQFRGLTLDAYLGLDFTLPSAKLAPLEAVVIPDMLPFTHPGTVSFRARWLYRRGIRRSISRGARLLCISAHTQSDLHRQFPDSADRSSVIRPALSARLARLVESSSEREYKLQVRGTLGSVIDPSRFLLYVGDFGARKNVGLLVSVFRSMVERGEYAGSLVLVGGDGRHSTLRQQPQLALQPAGSSLAGGGRQSEVYDIGRVPDSDLSQLYANADLLVNLSAAEGFGFPVLEALAHGTPALVTKGSAMETVAPGGIAATGLDPAEVERTLETTLAALPILRQEVGALPDDWANMERLGEELACALES
jgi:glycosyltransferase involved in cell wall biosynthesis